MEQEAYKSLEDQVQDLKQQGKSVREIAAALNITPSKVFRLTKQTEEPNARSGTAGETLLSLDNLERDVAYALQTEDTEHLTMLLTQLQQHEHDQSSRLAELRTKQAAAEQRLTDATLALNRTTDRLERIPLEETKAEARANLIEATTTLADAEQNAFPFATLIARIRARLHEIETAKKEAERQAVLVSASETLKDAQRAFLAALAVVEEKAAVLGETVMTDMPLATVRELVGKLRIGGLPARPLHEQVRVKFLRYGDRGRFAPDQICTMPWVHAREYIWQRVAEEIRHA